MNVTALSREDLVSEMLAPLPPTFAAGALRVSDADLSAPPSIAPTPGRRCIRSSSARARRVCWRAPNGRRCCGASTWMIAVR